MIRKNVSGMVLTLLLISMVMLTSGITPVKAEQMSASPWPMFQHDTQLTGRSEYVGPPNGEVKWISDIGPTFGVGGCSLQPVISSEGVVYFGTGSANSGNLYAFNSDGTLKWKSMNLEGFPQTPAVGSDGIIFVGTSDGVVYALNSDGTEKWKFYCGGPYPVEAVILEKDGTLYFTSRYWLYALNPDGSEQWNFQHTGYVYQHFNIPAVGPDGTVYVIDRGWKGPTDQYNGGLHALRPDGTLKWSKMIQGFDLSNPSVGLDGTIYVVGTPFSGAGGVYAFNPDGTLKWRAGLGGFSRHFITLGADGTIIAGGATCSGYPYSGLVQALSPEGNILWNFRPEGEIWVCWGLILDAEGTVFAPWSGGSATTRVYSIGAEGGVKWTLNVPERLLSYPAMGLGSQLYVAFESAEAEQPRQARLYCIGSTEPTNQPPSAFFTYNPHNPLIGDQVTFNASLSYDLDGEIISYQWDFGDSAIAEGIIANHSFSSTGFYTVTLTVTDNEGATNRVTETVKIWDTWTFTAITDLHIGRCYPDYGGKGIEMTEDMQVEGQDYYLTERLQRTVEWIIDNRDNYNIRFVVVLGDISDSGEYSELKKAKDILDKLNEEDVPYIPVIGNHDVWPHTTDEKNQDERYFELVFAEQFAKLERDASLNMRKQPLSDFLSAGDPIDLQNYAFDYKEMKFVILDCASRDATLFGKGTNPSAILYNSTKTWLKDTLSEGKSTILFSHHPMLENKLLQLYFGADLWEYLKVFFSVFDDIGPIGEIINESGSNVLGDFAGHIHGYYDEYHFWPFFTPGINPVFMDANKNYEQEGLFTPAGIPVVTTEALMVASNEPMAKGIMRLVEIRGDKINNYDTIEGEFYALNPYFKPTASVLFKDTLYQEFKAYAFTKIFTEELPLSYTMDFGDGETQTRVSTSGKPVTLFNYYKDWSQDKIYTVTLTVTGHTPDGSQVIVEKIVKNMTFSVSWLSIIAHSPVDIVVTDPEGLTISKQLNEIPDATYIEIDINADGDSDDIIVIPGRKIGDYLITVVPETDVAPTDAYTLEAWINGITTVLAENAQINNIPTQSYIIRSTETEIIPIIITWEYVFEDAKRDTMLKISTDDKYFQFIAPDKDFGIREATYMRLCGRTIIIRHEDNELRLITLAIDTKLDFCIAYAKDIQTGKEYWLIDNVGTEN